MRPRVPDLSAALAVSVAGLWIALIALLPWLIFFTRPMDLRHGAAAIAHCGIVLLSALWIATRTEKPITNWPLAAYVGYTALMWWWAWNRMIIVADGYPLLMALPLLHVISGVMFYVCATSQWHEGFIEELGRWVGYAAIAMLFLCALQRLNIDPFFKDESWKVTSDKLVGMLGNPSMLSAYGALVLPCLWTQRRWWSYAASLCWLVVMVLTHASGGLLAASVALLWCCWHGQRLWLIPLGVGLVSFLVWAGLDRTVVSFNGRWDAWQAFWQVFVSGDEAVRGLGLGFVFEYAKTVQTGVLVKWRHVHNEYFQILIEQGLIGLTLACWVIGDTLWKLWKLPKTQAVVMCGGIFTACLVISFVNYPLHLWTLCTLGLFAYSSLHVLAHEQGVASWRL